jgi:hypothetical protein
MMEIFTTFSPTKDNDVQPFAQVYHQLSPI